MLHVAGKPWIKYMLAGVTVVTIFILFNSERLFAAEHSSSVLPITFVEPLSEIEQKLEIILRSIKASCGEICDTTIKGKPGKYVEFLEKKVDCPALFSNPDIDVGAIHADPPKEIPTFIYDEFSHHGRWKIISDYRDDTKGVSHQLVWTKEDVQNRIKDFKSGKLQGNYGAGAVNDIATHLERFANITGTTTALVVGSQNPWLEAILLAKGVSHVTTFDYVKIKSEHPQIETITPDELSKKFFDGVRYDIVVTFSSLEHSGLGRYGDLLNPWGDLIAMARSWCLVKSGGLGLVGVPTGQDVIGFNSHRVYGRLGFAQLFANWEHVFTNADLSYDNKNCYYCYQPVHILRRP